MRKKFLLTTCIVFIIVFFSIIFLYITFATNDIQLDINSKDSILSNYEIKLDDINQPNEKILSTQNELPTITNKSEELLEKFNKKINVDKIEKIQQIYNNTLDRTTVRITFEDYKVDFDKNGNLVSYQNLNDYSTIDKDTKNAMELTESDNDYLYKYRGDTTIDEDKIQEDMKKGRIQTAIKKDV